jgi:hypothetical protein
VVINFVGHLKRLTVRVKLQIWSYAQQSRKKKIASKGVSDITSQLLPSVSEMSFKTTIMQ